MFRNLRKPPKFDDLARELLDVLPQAKSQKEAIATVRSFLEAAWRNKKKMFKP